MDDVNPLHTTGSLSIIERAGSRVAWTVMVKWVWPASQPWSTAARGELIINTYYLT